MTELHATELTDLLSSVGGGSREAFADLYDRVSHLVYRACGSVVRDPARAEFATEQTFLAIWRRATTFDPRQHDAIHWLLAITVAELARQHRASIAPVTDAPTPAEPGGRAA